MYSINYMELDWRAAILLGSALREGLIGAVAEEARPAEEIACELGLDARALSIVLSALAEMGILEEDEEGFRLWEEHRAPLLSREYPGYVGGRVIHRLELMQGWSRLPELLKSGVSAEDRTAPDFGSMEAFIRALRGDAQEGAGEIATAVLSRLPDGARILDVGGGPGTNAEAFSRGGAR